MTLLHSHPRHPRQAITSTTKPYCWAGEVEKKNQRGYYSLRKLGAWPSTVQTELTVTKVWEERTVESKKRGGA